MTAPSPAAVSAANDFVFEALADTCDLASSYARSAAEAAWRGERVTLRVHLMQLRLTTLAAIQRFKEISAEACESEKAA